MARILGEDTSYGGGACRVLRMQKVTDLGDAGSDTDLWFRFLPGDFGGIKVTVHLDEDSAQATPPVNVAAYYDEFATSPTIQEVECLPGEGGGITITGLKFTVLATGELTNPNGHVWYYILDPGGESATRIKTILEDYTETGKPLEGVTLFTGLQRTVAKVPRIELIPGLLEEQGADNAAVLGITRQFRLSVRVVVGRAPGAWRVAQSYMAAVRTILLDEKRDADGAWVDVEHIATQTAGPEDDVVVGQDDYTVILPRVSA